MTESKRTRKALEDVQTRWPRAVIYKFNDRKTKSIPDTCILHAGLSIWIEFKDGTDNESPEKLMSTPRGKLQLHELKRLQRAGAIALIGVFRPKGITLYNTDFLPLVSHGTLADCLQADDYLGFKAAV